MILPARLDKCRRGRGSLTLALVGALRLENHFLNLALIELKFFLSLLIIIINHREETGLKRAVGSVWGSLMVHCLDRHTHITLAGNKLWIIFENNVRYYCPFWGVEKGKSDTSLNKTVTSWCAIFRVYITLKYVVLLQKMRLVFRIFSREFSLISPKKWTP